MTSVIVLLLLLQGKFQTAPEEQSDLGVKT